MTSATRSETERFRRFIKNKEIQMKECLMYVLNAEEEKKKEKEKKEKEKEKEKNPSAKDEAPKFPPRCYCGEECKNHTLGTNSLEESTMKWEYEKAIHKLPTNAAGKIRFVQEDGVRRISDFIRVSGDTKLDVLLELFKNHWSLFTPKPGLVISILGGVKNLKMDSKISGTFKSGILMAAKSTNAWIITGGCNAGYMKLVGDAVAEWQGVQFDEKGRPREAVRCIGITPWGWVHDRHLLEAHTGPRKKSEKKADLGGVFNYHPSTIVEHKKPLSLNPHHTHYILVDNGYRNKFDPKVGDYRAKLERELSAKSGSNLGIPVVVVLVEGGDDAIKGCGQSIKHEIPVVVCKGTGRAADILAYAIENCKRTKTNDNQFTVDFAPEANNQLRDKIYRSYYEKFLEKFYDKWEPNPEDKDYKMLGIIKKEYKNLTSETLPRLLYLSNLPENMKNHCVKLIDTIVKDVKECCMDEDLLTSFDCKSDKEDFDYAILGALAKKKKTKATEQLRLALTWNRSDIVEKDIIPRHQNEPFEMSEVKDIIFDAILKDRVDFLHVMLSHGIVINDLLTLEMLRRLYRDALSDSNRNTPDANHVYRRLRHVGGRIDRSIQRELAHGNIRLCAVHKLISKLISSHYVSLSSNGEEQEYMCDAGTEFQLSHEYAEMTLGNPFRELFFFALLLNRPKMAEFFWERTEDCLCLALVAAKVFNSLANSCQSHQIDLKNSYLESKQKFEELACSLCNESYKTSYERGLILVERQYDVVGGSNCLEIGSSAKAQAFLSTTCCQEALEALWKQGILSSTLFIFVALLLPFLVPLVDIEKPDKDDKDEDKDKGGLKVGQQVVAFYRAPVTKFVFWYTSFLLYLLLYTYVLIFNYDVYPSPIEITVYCWTFTLLVDSLAEIKHIRSRRMDVKINEKLKLAGSLKKSNKLFQPMRWLRSSVWNPAMMVGYILHLSGVICRFVAKGDKTLNYCAKVLLTCCLFISICLFSRVFSVHAWLGPKLVMIRKMLVELGRWLIILTIFNIAFGVMRVAILFRGDQILNYKTIDAIVYFPFWNLWNDYDMTLDPDAEYYCSESDQHTMYGQPCPENFELIPILLAAYLIIAKIMLCNLLIAILNNIYGDIQQNSLQVWKYNFFQVAKWAEGKTVLPPPIGFFIHLFCCCDAFSSNKQEMSYMPNHIEQLRIFEREMLVSMSKTQSEAHRLTVDGQIKAVRESIGQIEDKIKDLHNREPIARRDQNKIASKLAQYNWDNLLQSTVKKPATRPPMFGKAVSNAEQETASVLSNRISGLEDSFMELETSLNTALNEINSAASKAQ